MPTLNDPTTATIAMFLWVALRNKQTLVPQSHASSQSEEWSTTIIFLDAMPLSTPMEPCLTGSDGYSFTPISATTSQFQQLGRLVLLILLIIFLILF
ncbi:hypothetical protein V8D89_007083 [Ganoderma adspersum]